MTIKSYSVTLDEDVVDDAKKIVEETQRKLSPVINNLLKKWVQEENKKKDIN